MSKYVCNFCRKEMTKGFKLMLSKSNPEFCYVFCEYHYDLLIENKQDQKYVKHLNELDLIKRQLNPYFSYYPMEKQNES